MSYFAIAFLCGDLILQQFANLPSMQFICLVLICNSIIFPFFNNKFFLIVFGLIVGFSWTAFYALEIKKINLPSEFISKPILIEGKVISIPVYENNTIHFLFQIKKILVSNQFKNFFIRVKLSYRSKDFNIKASEVRQFLVKLKPIHSTQNPGAFDFERWAFQNNIRAQGYVLTNHASVLIHRASIYSLLNVRQKIRDQIVNLFPYLETSKWLLALSIGDQSQIDAKSWEVLRTTGTNHLMAIAGLHLGIIATFTYYLCYFLWRRVSYFHLLISAQNFSRIGSFSFAFLYTLLSGFSLPLQRAFLMVSIFYITQFLKFKMHAFDVLILCMFIVLVLNPLQPIVNTFWLSFLTITIIIYAMGGRFNINTIWWKWGRVQAVISIGLIPLTLYFFQEVSFVGFISNCIAIPMIEFGILPFCLIGTFFIFSFSKVSFCCFWIAHKNLQLLFKLLSFFASLPHTVFHFSIYSPIDVMVLLIAFFLLLLPAGVLGRWLSILSISFVLFKTPERPQKNEIWINLLDVGQGLSVMLQTKHHTLIYDAGPKYNDKLDAGDSILLPFLRYKHINMVDKLVVSHGDNDHIGGVKALLAGIKVNDILTSVPEKLFSQKTKTCIAGDHWQWDGVNFKVLYPDQDHLGMGNDSSCVLQINNGIHSILLTGDIEKYAEQVLLESNTSLKSDILIAPHHGSKTSILMSFIHAVTPQIVLYATGFLNQFHFPNKETIKKYAAVKAQQYNSAETGTIQIKISSKIETNCYRHLYPHYWYHQ